MRALFFSALRLLYLVGMILIAVDALAMAHVPPTLAAVIGLPLGLFAAFFLMDRYYRFQERKDRKGEQKHKAT